MWAGAPGSRCVPSTGGHQRRGRDQRGPKEEELVEIKLRLGQLQLDKLQDPTNALPHVEDVLREVVPAYLLDSDYASYFTGMFLAQCKLLGQRRVGDMLGELVTVDVDAPLEKRTPGGLGLHLIQNLVDTLEYEYQDGRGEVIFTKGSGTDNV